MEAVETPSGKDSGQENFPVGSWLIAPRLRPHVATFYAFARAIDDIADNPALAPADKLARLERFERALLGPAPGSGYEKAERLRRSLAETGVDSRHGRDLISAFKQDAVQGRYESWEALMDYCRRSAAPVGRYLLDLHGESRDAYGASDALCHALQVINHLQDCADDYRDLDRVYLPGDWMGEAGARVEMLGEPAAPAALRAVLVRCVDGTRALLDEARRLPAGLRSRRLAFESAVIVTIAERLTERLAREDPLAGRVALGRREYLGCALGGLWAGLRRGRR